MTARRRVSKISCAGAGFGAFMIVICSAFPASAEDVYGQATRLYKDGKYNEARHYFEHIVNLKPNYWPAVYQLANTQVKLGQLDAAEANYRRCLSLNPDAATAKACAESASRLSSHLALKSAARDAQAKEDEKREQLKTEIAEKARLQYESKRNEAEEKRRKILEDAQREAAAIRARAQMELRDIQANSNYWVRNPQTGEVFVGVPDRVAREITGNAEAKARQILDSAEARARGIQLPTGGPTTSLESHLADSGKRGGTTVSPHGTNLHVRNYVHKPSATASTGAAGGKKVATGGTGAL